MAPSVQAGSRYTIERFDGTSNFADWQARMEDLLTTLGLCDTLQEKKPDDMQDRAWEKALADAVSNIRMYVSTGVRNHLTGLKTPKDIWAKLETLYQAKTLTSKIYAQQAFYGLRMQGGGDLVHHLTVFNNALAELTRLGIKVDDEVKAVVLLCSLPPSYAHLVTTLTYGKDTVKLDDISSTLLAHEQRSRCVEEGGSSGDGIFVKGGAERGRGTKRGESSRKKKKSFKSKDRSKAECFHCKQIGHWKRDCPNKGGSNHGNAGTAANVVQSTETRSSEDDMLCVSSTKCTEAWILDSGCSYHMTPHREWFHSFKEGDFGFVFLGDDKHWAITGMGQVKVALEEGGVRTLGEVRYVPELRKNVISLGTLQANGYSFKSDGDRDIMKVSKGARTVMKARRTQGNIYKLLGSTVVEELHKRDLLRGVQKQTVSEKEGEKIMAHLVAKGVSQQKGVEYGEIFSPDVIHTSMRAGFALVACNGMVLEQLEVKTASLHGKIEEQIYVERSEGFEETGQRQVCNVKRSLHGLKQLPRQWCKRFDSYVLKMEHRRCGCCEGVRSLDEDLTFLLLCDEIPRYLRGAGDRSIREQLVLSVVGNKDSGYGDMDDRRSTTEMVGGPFCWKSSVQLIVAMSTTEVEYVVVAAAAKEASWLRGIVREVGVEQGGVQWHCVLVKVDTAEDAADMLTKPVTSDKFKHCLDLLHVTRS